LNVNLAKDRRSFNAESGLYIGRINIKKPSGSKAETPKVKIKL